MLNDFRKSIQSVLYERVQSPVSGAFFFSWIVWNWKLIFYLIFSNVLISERINFVQENYINIWNNLGFPFLSTLFLIVLYPFITTAGYWVWLKFKTWQINIRNEIEKNRLLTLEQSITLRMQIRDQELELDKMLTKRDDEIELLKRQLEEFSPTINQELFTVKAPKKDSYLEEFQKFKKSEYYKRFNVFITAISSRMNMHEFAKAMEIAYYESNDIIKHDKGVLYSFTEKGQQFVKYHLDQIKST